MELSDQDVKGLQDAVNIAKCALQSFKCFGMQVQSAQEFEVLRLDVMLSGEMMKRAKDAEAEGKKASEKADKPAKK